MARCVCSGSIKREERKLEAMKARLERRVAEKTRRIEARHEAAVRRIDGQLEARLRRSNQSTPARRKAASRRAHEAHRRQVARLRQRRREQLARLRRCEECRILGRERSEIVIAQSCGQVCDLGLPDGIGGNETIVALPATRSAAPRTIPARFVLISASKIIPSHDAQTFHPRPDYPPGEQERRYESDVKEQLKVVGIAQNMAPHLLANTNAGVIDGTPVTTLQGYVLGGNGRSMGAQRHYLLGRTELRDFLMRHAIEFGFTREQVAAIPDPIVVRVIDVRPEERPRLVRDMNVSMTQQMDVLTEATARARQLPADVPRILHDARAEEAPAEFLRGPASAGLVGALERSGWINQANRGRLLTADGVLTSEARDELEPIFTTAAVGGGDLVERAPLDVREALRRSAIAWLAAAGAGAEWDVRRDLAAAVSDLRTMRVGGQCLAQWLRQEGLERPATDRSPVARRLLQILDLTSKTPTKVRGDRPRLRPRLARGRRRGAVRRRSEPDGGARGRRGRPQDPARERREPAPLQEVTHAVQPRPSPRLARPGRVGLDLARAPAVPPGAVPPRRAADAAAPADAARPGRLARGRAGGPPQEPRPRAHAASVRLFADEGRP